LEAENKRLHPPNIDFFLCLCIWSWKKQKT